MIKLTRPTTVPNILITNGTKKCKSHCNSFKRFSAKYISGHKTFKFDSKIYGHESVKKVLINAQNDKCCFCESKVTHIAYGDIEHFRPKAAFINKKGDKLERPGYYWLAYEWTNLLFSCQICNQRFKKNLFPILNPKSRAKDPKDNITKEKPVFINPYDEDPKKHIGFKKEMPYGKTVRGTETIKALGLERDKLNEIRLTYYKLLKTIYKMANASPSPSNGIEMSDIIDAQNSLKELTSIKGQYTEMVNTAIKNKFSLII